MPTSPQPQGVSQKVAVADPAYPSRVIKPNADGSINVVGSGSGPFGDVGILDASDVRINPATEDTLSDVLTALNTPAAELPPTVPVPAGNTEFTFVPVDISSAATTPLVSASGGTTVRVHKGLLVIAGANVLQFQSNSVDVGGPLTFGSAGGSINFDDDVYPELRGTASENLQLVTSTTAAVGGWLWVKQD